MRFALVSVAVALAACGGSSFDRDAAVAHLGPEGVDVSAVELCEETEDRVYELTLAMMLDADDFDGIAAQAYGCADRYRNVAVTNGWPLP